MNPVKVRALQVIEYWSCCNVNHRHTTEAAAKICIGTTKTDIVMTAKERRINSTFRSVEALTLFLEVESFKDVSVLMSLSTTRAMQVVAKGCRIVGAGNIHLKERILSNKHNLLGLIDSWKLKQLDLGNIINKRG